MSDRTRAKRGVDGRDAVHRTAEKASVETRRTADETERLGRDQQRRATAYGRARGRL